MKTMKTGVTVTVLALAVLLALSSCATLTLDAKGLDKPVSMTNVIGDDVAYRVIDQVKGKTRAVWLFGMRLADADVRDILIDEAPGADAFVNVEITTKQTFLDWFVSTASQSVLTMRTVIIEGTAVEY